MMSELWLDSDDDNDESSRGIEDEVEEDLGIFEMTCLGRRLRRR